MLISEILFENKKPLRPKKVTGQISDVSSILNDQANGIYRPIQYLGSKLRSASKITSITNEITHKKGTFLDLFTGTSVVAQSLANSGWRVTANDVQAYSFVFAAALLGLGRSANEEVPARAINKLPIPAHLKLIFGQWENLSQAEADLLENCDCSGLEKLYRNLPLFWKQDQNYEMNNGFNIKVGEKAFFKAPLLTSIQAGTYFGIKQSLEIDLIRNKIEIAFLSKTISGWQKYALLTALMSAMSKAVYSAGKHFAQPLTGGNSKNQKFRHQRLLADRKISIQSQFFKSAKEIGLAARYKQEGHRAVQTTAEKFLNKPNQKFDVVYADPPYTAQQYSRFYHILETTINYLVPDLNHNGQVTKGLYPKERFKSAFCSKRAAGLAFNNMVSQVKKMDACLLLSYSRSSTNSNGNARMISLPDLIDLCRFEYGKNYVECKELPHRYRQFNSLTQANPNRNDPEILIVCRPK